MRSYRKQMTVNQVIKTATSKLSSSRSPSPSIDAKALLCHVLNEPQVYLLAHPEKVLSIEAYQLFFALVKQRCSGKPIAYITGKKEFWSLILSVSAATLIPRPETEKLVEVVLDYSSSVEGAILDLGTGVAILLSEIRTDRA